MFEMTHLPNTDVNSDVKDIKRLLEDSLVNRGNKKFRRIYLMFHKLNHLVLEVAKGNLAEELIVNNVPSNELYNYSSIEFSKNDFKYLLNEVTADDFVLIIPPLPYEKNSKTEHDESFQNCIKTNLQNNIQNFIEELDKKQATFMMFYGRLDKPNDYPVYWQWGHVIYLSMDDDKCRDSLHHLYLSRNLAKLVMTPAHYGRSIQPLFYRIFEVQAEQNPNRIAVASDKYNLTYKDLNEAANRMAHILLNNGLDELQSKRAKRNKDCVIVIAVDRDDPQLIIAKLAIEKIGVTYTLFNTDTSRLPIESCIQRLVTSHADFIITYNEYFQKIMSAPAALKFKNEQVLQLIEIFRDDNACEKIFMNLSFNSNIYSQNLNRNISPLHVLTHAYTSGSTGVPKAARIAARGYPFAVIAHVDAGRLEFGTNTLQFSSVDFDASQLEEKMTLAVAGKLVLMNQAAYTDHIKLMRILETYKINCLTVTPNMLSLLLTHRSFPFISFCLVVGDKVNKELLDKLWDKLVIYNKPFYILIGYGTTQTTIQGSYQIYEKGKSLTVGYPALGVNIELLSLNKLASVANTHDYFTKKMIKDCGATMLKPQDEENNATEEGVICTYGPCNMLGYVGGEIVDSDVLYNTKDIGYLLKTGMKIKGRIGRFFKINSQAGDLTEIETVIKEYKEVVKDCRAVIHNREVQNVKVNVLAVYIVPVNNKLIIKDASSPSSASIEALKDLQSFMRAKLQAWKIPALVNMLFVSELLVKKNDKISFDDQEMCKKWSLPCIRLTGSRIFRDQLTGLSSDAKNFIKITQQIAAECLNLLPTEIPLDVNFPDFGFDSIQFIQFINYLKRIDLTAIGIHNEKFKKALDILSVDDFKNIGTLLQLYKHLQNSSLILKRQSDDRDCLIKRLPSKSIEKFMLKDFRIYNNESYGVIEETIWWLPSILGNTSIDYGASKILQLPLHNNFLACPDLNCLRELHNLDDLADHYMKKIISSRGFVFLGGWSSGGLLCKKIKEKLQKQGIKVILFLLDTVVPDKLQQMNALVFAEEIYDIANKIRASILLLLSLPESTQFNIPSLEELKLIDVKEDQLTQLIGQIKVSFVLLRKSSVILDEQAIDKCLALIEYVHFFLKTELDRKASLIAELDESDIFIVSDASEAKYGKSLGWKVNSNVQVEVIENTDHFSLLNNIQLVHIIKKRIIKELINLMEPYYQGLAYVISGKFKLAIECFNEVQLKNSGYPGYLYSRAEAYLNLQNYDKALEDLTLFIAKFPENITALTLQGRVLVHLERNIEAADVFLKILQITNDVKEIRKIAPFVGIVLFSEHDSSSGDLDNLLPINKLHTILLTNSILKSYLYWVKAMHLLTNSEEIEKEAVNFINSSINFDPENKEAYIARAKINLQLRKFNEAIADLDKAVSLGVKNESLLFYYARIKFEEEKYIDAVNLFTKLIAENNSYKGEAYHYRGLCHICLKHNDEAIKDLTSALHFKNDTKTLIARANTYYTQKMFEKAYFDFVNAIKLGANNAVIYYRTALSIKETIKTVSADEDVKMICQFYAKACKYLEKAKASLGLGEASSILKRQIEIELSNMKNAYEAHKIKYEVVIDRAASDDNVSKEPSPVQSLAGMGLFKNSGEVLNKQKPDIRTTVMRHMQEDPKPQSIMPTTLS